MKTIRDMILGALLFGSVAYASYIIPDGSVTSAKLRSNLNLPGKAVQEGSQNILVSNANTTNSLAVIRITIAITVTAGNITSATASNGEGYSVSGSSSSSVSGSFTTTFGDTPVAIISTAGTNTSANIGVAGLSSSGFVIATSGLSGSYSTSFFMIVIGQRS